MERNTRLDDVMDTDKTIGLTFRVTPQMKRMLEAAAEHERRSLTNMFEVMVEDFCERHAIPQQHKSPAKQAANRVKKPA